MAADVTIGPLPGMTEVLIEPTADCYASTNGVYDDGGGDETQSLGPWERPTTQIATQPLAAINGLMDGAWTIQEYTAIVNDLRVTDAYGATVECYYINRTSLSQDKIFLGISTDIGGSLQLLTGNEPMFWPYFVKIVYKVYTNGSGDCILRIAALILPRASIPEPTTPSLPPRSLYFGFENVGTAYNWPHTTTAFQYSDFNPCAEDMGFNAGAWVSGNNYELLDGPIVASEGVTASGPNGLYALADLTQSDEVVVLEETPTGSAPALGLLWEINLTTSAIADLHGMSPVALNSSNAIGVMQTTDIDGAYTPVGSLPAGYFDQFWSFYDPASTIIDPASFLRQTLLADAPLDYGIVNDGAGGHICGTRAIPGTCDTFPNAPYDGGGFVQQDRPYWEYSTQLLHSTFNVLWNTISISFRPPTP